MLAIKYEKLTHSKIGLEQNCLSLHLNIFPRENKHPGSVNRTFIIVQIAKKIHTIIGVASGNFAIVLLQC